MERKKVESENMFGVESYVKVVRGFNVPKIGKGKEKKDKDIYPLYIIQKIRFYLREKKIRSTNGKYSKEILAIAYSAAYEYYFGIPPQS